MTLGKPAKKLCISQKPGVGMSYVVKTKNAEGEVINARIATTCSRDTNAAKGGLLVDHQIANYTNGDSKRHEKYFSCKLGRKGNTTFVIFLCSEHHKKCMGFSVSADKFADGIDTIMKKVESHFSKDEMGRTIISGFVDNLLEYEWTEESLVAAQAAGKVVHKYSKDGEWVLEPTAGDKDEARAKRAELAKTRKAREEAAKRAGISTSKKTAAKKATKKTTAKKSAAKKPKAEVKAEESEEVEVLYQADDDEDEAPIENKVEEKPVKKTATETAKKSGAVKKKKKTFYTVNNGKIDTLRRVNKPEGYLDTREEAQALIDAQA